MIRHFLNPPNWFTAASIFCSTYALALLLAATEITPDLLSHAAILVIFGGIFDLLDGRVARRRRDRFKVWRIPERARKALNRLNGARRRRPSSGTVSDPQSSREMGHDRDRYKAPISQVAQIQQALSEKASLRENICID